MELISAKSVGDLLRHGMNRISVACGVFDGVHRGHQQVLCALLAQCRETRSTPVALTFEPHPRALLSEAGPPPRLTLPEQKLELLSRYGAAAVVVLEFNGELAAMAPDDFVEAMLLAPGVTIESLCVGAEWRFGRNGIGDVDCLARLGSRHGFTVTPVPELWIDGVEVGSTRIREALANGDLDTAALYLGRDYVVVGTIGHGRGIGGELFSCPTANIAPAGQMLPADGVYAVRIHVDVPKSRVDGLEDHPEMPGIAYVGTSPTIDDAARQPVLEAHLFDFDGDLYGRHLAVRFVRRIREDRRFSSINELAGQMQHDIANARQVLRALPQADPRT